MTHDRRFTAEKIKKRIALVEHLVRKNQLPIEPFRYLALGDAHAEPPLGADPAGWPEITWNSYWAGQNQNFFLVSSFTIPVGWADGPIALYLPMGAAGDIFTHPESLVYIDGQPFASADRYHHTIYLDPGLADGLPHRLELHGWSGLTGWPPDPHDGTRLYMKPCAVVEIDLPARDLLSLARVALEVAIELPAGAPEKYGILNALDAAFMRLDTRDPLGDAFYRSTSEALRCLSEGLQAAGRPLDVRLHAIGHAHMDVAYLWPVSQIRRKNARTYANVLRLMERFPDYRFSHSQPQLYEYTRQDYPEIFAAIQDRVAEGRWEVMGGMWVEPDTNIPGGEALVRQLVLGRRFFQEYFGAAETPVLWLPDVFGLSWCLPQLLEQAGIKWVVSNKFSWNQYNQMTASTIWWQGLDGTKILTHFLTTPRDVQHLPFPTSYKSELSAAEVIGTWQTSSAKEQIRDLPICYGYGDGGGGPTGELIRRAEVFAAIPSAPSVQFSTVRQFFAAIEGQTADLHVWANELYLEGHRGVLTSQGWIKRANRQAEAALHEVEFLAAMASLAGVVDAEEELDTAWKLLALNQFHDVLPGTSIGEVFADSAKDFAKIDRLVDTVRARALAVLAAGRDRPEPVLINALPFAMSRQVELDDALAAQCAGQGQRTEQGILCQINDLAPYSLSSVRFDAPAQPVRVIERADGVVLENGLLRVEINERGELSRVVDLEAAREVLAPGEAGNRLQAFEDRPLSWDAWDIDTFFEDRGEIIGGLVGLTIIETGPLRASVRIERSYRASTITQEIRLRADSKRLDFVTEADWHETHILLKVAFPVQILAQEATYEIQWGSIQRPTHRSTLWDYAKFEVPAHKWADLSEGNYGVALLNNCKYGYDIRDHVMRLSLIKSATMPDENADQGKHRFTYGLLPHQGDWRQDVLPEAYDLNWPLQVAQGHRPAEHNERALVRSMSGNVIVETIKPAIDGNGIIVRLFEAHRARGPVRLQLGQSFAEVRRCDLLEQDEAVLATETDVIELELRPSQIFTLRLVP